ncbi:MAG: glycoside hydrolase family 127 protein [Bacteroidetes bacterium]|nr:glycoside hydrolase family 127 protein [Bacteroidota bacterium]
MKPLLVSLFLSVIICANAQQKDYPIQAVDFTKVTLQDQFWTPRIETNRLVTIPASFARCESTGRVKNFLMAAAKSGKFCTRYPFDDTDIYKTIEGASFTLALHYDAKLDAYLDSMIQIIANAQEPDGYLYTARTIDKINVNPFFGKERWEKEREHSHELYNAGHLYEAAAAHFLATKKTTLLNIALKNADLVCSVFGPDKRHVAPGHEIIEMGLVKLYRITGKAQYLNTAKYFIEERGNFKGYDAKSKDPFKNGAYWQDDIPVKQQQEAEGHAVRAGYLYSAMADIAALTEDKEMLAAVDRIWKNETGKKMYVQGGVGAIGDGERFGANYELPNATAYNETCAAIANIYFNQRMFLLHGDAQYIDVLEKVLYNGFLSGVGLDGKSFFYTNAMQIHHYLNHADMESERSGWFECSCCPTNIARMMPSIPGYIYAQKNDSIYANLFIAGTASLQLNHKSIQIKQENNYPWDGNLKFIINTAQPTDFNMLIRIPGWAQNIALPNNLYHFTNVSTSKVVILINGKNADYQIQNGYAILKRTWQKNDLIQVILPMESRKVASDTLIKDNIGKLSLQRGPLMYCAEWKDNSGTTSNIILPATSKLNAIYNADLLHGVVELKSQASIVEISANGQEIKTNKKPFTAIPYYAWANRGKGEMTVWIPEKITAAELITK